MKASLNYTDLVIILFYLTIIVLWALRNRQAGSSQAYFLAGRRMTWPMVGLSLFAASVSSATLIGQSAEAFKTGFAVYNYQWISVLVMVFFAVFFLPFYINNGVYTMPEFLERRYDKRARYYFSFITIIGNVFLDAAAALYAGGMIIKLIYPAADLFVVIAILGFIAGVYTIPGGLSSAISAEIVQGVVLIFGSVLLAFLAVNHIGGWEVFFERLETGFWLHVVRPMSDPAVPWPGMIVGIPVLAFYFWGNNQVMVQRVLSAKSVDHGRKGVLLVGLLYLFTLFIFIAPGLVARLIPGLFEQDIPLSLFGNEVLEAGIDVNEVYPRLIMKLMPVGIMGVVLAAMISALTSSLSASLNSASTLFTMDFYQRLNPNAPNGRLVIVGKISSLVILVIAVVWAPNIHRFGSLVDYYQEMVSYLAPPIVALFILGLFNKRVNGHGAFAGLAMSFAVSVVMLFFKSKIPLVANIHFLLFVPFLFLFGAIVTIAVSLLTRPPSRDKIVTNTWNKTYWIAETKALKGVPWYSNFRVLSVGLIIACFFMFILFF